MIRVLCGAVEGAVTRRVHAYRQLWQQCCDKKGNFPISSFPRKREIFNWQVIVCLNQRKIMEEIGTKGNFETDRKGETSSLATLNNDVNCHQNAVGVSTLASVYVNIVT